MKTAAYLRLFAFCALAGAAACQKPGEGITRISTGPDSYGHRYLDSSGSVAYLKGRYPMKTYLCTYSLEKSRKKCRNYKNYRLVDGVGYFPPKDLILLPAVSIGSKAEKPHLLAVSASDRALVREIPIPSGSKIAGLAAPAWSKDFLLVLESGGRSYLGRLNPETGKMTETLIGNFSARMAAFPEHAPVIVLEVQKKKKTSLVLFDAEESKILKQVPYEYKFDDIQHIGEVVWGLYAGKAGIPTTLVRIDLESGNLDTVAPFEGLVESGYRSGRSLLLIEKDGELGKKAPDIRFHPRRMHIIDPSGNRAPTVQAWTKRFGRFFGADPKTGSIFYSTTEPASAWMIRSDPETLSRAAAELDRRAGSMFGSDWTTWAMLGFCGALLLLVAFLIKNWSG